MKLDGAPGALSYPHDSVPDAPSFYALPPYDATKKAAKELRPLPHLSD
jgi:hypothetical protein